MILIVGLIRIIKINILLREPRVVFFITEGTELGHTEGTEREYIFWKWIIIFRGGICI